MPEQIFDQDRPRSAMARRLDEAFAGCDEWTIAPPSPRRDTLDVASWLTGTDHASARPATGESSRLPHAA